MLPHCAPTSTPGPPRLLDAFPTPSDAFPSDRGPPAGATKCIDVRDGSDIIDTEKNSSANGSTGSWTSADDRRTFADEDTFADARVLDVSSSSCRAWAGFYTAKSLAPAIPPPLHNNAPLDRDSSAPAIVLLLPRGVLSAANQGRFSYWSANSRAACAISGGGGLLGQGARAAP